MIYCLFDLHQAAKADDDDFQDFQEAPKAGVGDDSFTDFQGETGGAFPSMTPSSQSRYDAIFHLASLLSVMTCCHVPLEAFFYS